MQVEKKSRDGSKIFFGPKKAGIGLAFGKFPRISGDPRHPYSEERQVLKWLPYRVPLNKNSKPLLYPKSSQR